MVILAFLFGCFIGILIGGLLARMTRAGQVMYYRALSEAYWDELSYIYGLKKRKNR